jgi:hypothetical protein
MNMIRKILEILKNSPKYTHFIKKYPTFDIIDRVLSEEDIDRIRQEYPELHLFPDTTEELITITLVSRVLMENGYPKLKAYIDINNEKIVHLFISN